MAYSLGLTLYNLRPARRTTGAGVLPARPAGRLVCLHAPNLDAAGSILQLARRLIEDDGISVVLTCPDAVPSLSGDVLVQPPPADIVPEIKAFLDHWSPELMLFAEGEVRPALVHACAERKIPLMMVDGRAPYIQRDREGWFPGLLRHALGSFDAVIAINEAAARDFRKAGAPQGIVRALGRMEDASAALPCNEAERAGFARLLMSRPVWFAAALPPAEEAAVIAAHRAAQNHAHRLLLILAPENPGDGAGLAARLDGAEGWVVARRSLDEEPEADVDVYIADGEVEDLGLWYRLAPLTFLGGSLAGAGCIRSPMEAAALGSAILCGSRAGNHGALFGRLGAAQAARAIASAADLADAVGEMLSPDRAARLAQAAWAVTSEGAEATEAVVAMLRRLMDGEG
jgi:3-deoxy-D-manno-octulosonic-acid transferase